MTEAVQEALVRLAPLMRDRKPFPVATIFYDVLSDAIIWSDEMPDLQELRKIDGWQVMRLVLHFRTQLILGRPEESDPDAEGIARRIFAESRDAWTEAKGHFPEWPGFDPRRCTLELRGTYEALSYQSRLDLDEIERELDSSDS